MPLDYTFLEEGDAYTAASINDRFSTLQSGINDLTTPDIEEGALRSEHLPSMLFDSGTARLTSADSHTYTSVYPGYASDTGWDMIVQDGLPMWVGLGASGAASWDSSFDFSSPNLVAAILVMADIEVRRVTSGTGVSPQTFAVFTLAVRDSDDVWRVVPHTERWVQAMTDEFTVYPDATGDYINCNQTLSIRSCLTVGNLNTISSSSPYHSDGIIRDVALFVSVQGNSGSISKSAASSDVEVDLRNGVLSALVLKTSAAETQSTTETS